MRATRTKWLAAATAALAAIALSACGAGKKDNGSSASPSGGANSGAAAAARPAAATITIGTTDQVIALDPAGAYDFGSSFFINNLYQFLMNVPAGGKTPQPDAAQSCSFTKPTEYTCTMKPGLKFSNGDPLTAKDVAFSFTRVVKIADPNGPSSLLANMASVAAPSDSKVVFTLKNRNDQTFPYILGTAAGPIVDSKVFPATKELPDSQIIGSGPVQARLVRQEPAGEPDREHRLLRCEHAEDAEHHRQDLQRVVQPQAQHPERADRRRLPHDDAERHPEPVQRQQPQGHQGRRWRAALHRLQLQDDAGRQRRAEAGDPQGDGLLGRPQPLASQVYKGTYQPAYSMVAPGIKGATTPFKDVYGTTPDKAKAQQVLQQAGVKTPVNLNIEYTTDHYGPTSPQEYGAIKRQLEATGLFKVTLGSALYTVYSPARVKDTYPIYQLGWFPDYVNADDYLSPFLVPDNFVCGALLRCEGPGRKPALRQGQGPAAARSGGDAHRRHGGPGARQDPERSWRPARCRTCRCCPATRSR